MRLTTTMTLATAALSLWAADAAAKGLRFANFMPPGHPYVQGALQPFADMAAKRTGGGVTSTGSSCWW